MPPHNHGNTIHHTKKAIEAEEDTQEGCLVGQGKKARRRAAGHRAQGTQTWATREGRSCTSIRRKAKATEHVPTVTNACCFTTCHAMKSVPRTSQKCQMPCQPSLPAMLNGMSSQSRRRAWEGEGCCVCSGGNPKEGAGGCPTCPKFFHLKVQPEPVLGGKAREVLMMMEDECARVA